MNILAQKQNELYEENLSEFELLERFKKFEKLYFETREKSDNSVLGKLTLKQRQKMHNLLLKGMILSNKLQGETHEIIADKRGNSNGRPIIFAPNHVAKSDVSVLSEAIKDHHYLLSGDYEHLQGTFDEKLLHINGVLYFKEDNADERRRISKTMIEHCLNGGNILYFIEGTWCLSPNQLLYPTWWGIIDVAKESNALILPIGICRYGQNFKINIGEYFDVNSYGTSKEDKTKAIVDLRNIIATLDYEIYETEVIKRSEIPDNYWEDYVKEVYAGLSNTHMDFVKTLMYKPKDCLTKEEVYEPIRKLQKNFNNDENIYASEICERPIYNR